MSAALTQLVNDFHIDAESVVVQVRQILAGADSAPPLSESDRALLSGGGLDLSAGTDPERELTRAMINEIEVRSGYTAEEVAANNSVQPGRVRSWLSAGDLVAVKVDGRNRFPRFQFDDAGRRRPGLAQVNRARPPHWGWRVWRNFLTQPHPAFESADGQPQSALDWLADGGDLQHVIDMTRIGW